MSERRYVHDRETHNRRAAERVVPYLMERYGPTSVVDVGCGLGSWLAVFGERGCRILGLEGEAVPDELLEIPRASFRQVDLEEPIALDERFDMALCLEVAEHLTESAGRRLVELLTGVSDLVVFSAAVPGQGGDNHLTERWPKHWQRLFEDRGFACDDQVRWRFWSDDEVEWWYRQNMFVARRADAPGDALRPVVHPGLLAKKVRTIDDFYRGRVPLRTGLLVFARAVLNALRRR